MAAVVVDETPTGGTDLAVDDAEEREVLNAYIQENNERIQMKAEQRVENLRENIKYPEDRFFVKLDSSIKKNSAFVKKLKNFTEAQREPLIKEMNGLNLSKYISEVASSIVEAKLKMSDINSVIKISSLLHQRYPTFSAEFLESWQKVIPKKPTDLATLNPSKMRTDLRLFAELISSGIFTLKEGLPVLGSLLNLLTVNDKENHSHLSILLSFCRHCGEDYAGLVPRKIKQLSEKYGVNLEKSDFLVANRQENVKTLLRDYYTSLCAHVLRDHRALQNQERQNRKSLMAKGELSSDRKEKFEQHQVAFQKLFQLTQQLSDIVDEPMPELPPDLPDLPEEYAEITISSLDAHRNADFDASSLWEDEDTRSFYETFPNLKELVPAILYKDSVKEAVKEPSKEESEPAKEEGAKTPTDPEPTDEGIADDDAVVDMDVDVDDAAAVELLLQDDAEVVVDESDEEESSARDNTDANPAIKVPQTSQANKILLDSFLASLTTCVSREMIDKAAMTFCTTLNTKYNRKKLTRQLFSVPRTRLDLLPFYSRLVATLNPVMPQLSIDLVQLLKQDFRFLVRKKDQINIESKIKTVRFMGELVKFHMFSKVDALNSLKLLLFDFTHHAIEMTVNLIETCGRFLFRSPDSHHRCKLLLEQMMRKKALLPYDSRYITMIENVYYSANPPEAQSITRIERPPLHQYIRKLLYTDLCSANADKQKILKQVRKLNWDDKDTRNYTIRCFIAAWNVKFYSVRSLACLLANLAVYQEWVLPQVVDGVLEDIRLGMEVNHPKLNQRRLAMVKYLGEMYNYKIVDISVLFKELYSFITYGINMSGEASAEYEDVDPADNLFRIRMVCQLLDTSGQYFSSSSAKKQTDCFIIFFQRYFWLKKSNPIWQTENKFPVSIEWLVQDCLTALRPRFSFATNYDDANARVEKLIGELKPKLLEAFPDLNREQQGGGGSDESRADSVNLGAIVEEGETEDSEQHADDSFDELTGSDNNYPQNTEELDSSDDVEDEVGEDDQRTLDRVNELAPRTIGDKMLVKCAEDDDFQKDFDKLLAESITQRSDVARQTNVNEIVIPLTSNSSGGRPLRQVAFDFNGASQQAEEPVMPTTMNLMVMQRGKSNKAQLKSVQVPLDSELAMSLRQQEEAARREKEHHKQLTLLAAERGEMTESGLNTSTGSSAAIGGVFNINQTRRHQHQKGVPDVDKIFR